MTANYDELVQAFAKFLELELHKDSVSVIRSQTILQDFKIFLQLEEVKVISV